MGLDVTPQQLRSTANAAQAAVGLAKGHDGSDALTNIATALPGADPATSMSTAATQWSSEVTDWSGSTEAFGDALDHAAHAYETTDNLVVTEFLALMAGS